MSFPHANAGNQRMCDGNHTQHDPSVFAGDKKSVPRPDSASRSSQLSAGLSKRSTQDCLHSTPSTPSATTSTWSAQHPLTTLPNQLGAVILPQAGTAAAAAAAGTLRRDPSIPCSVPVTASRHGGHSDRILEVDHCWRVSKQRERREAAPRRVEKVCLCSVSWFVQHFETQ